MFTEEGIVANHVVPLINGGILPPPAQLGTHIFTMDIKAARLGFVGNHLSRELEKRKENMKYSK